MTRVAVTDGIVNVIPSFNPAFSFKVNKGGEIRITPSIPHPRIENITPDNINELSSIQNMKIKETGTDQWNEIMDLVVTSVFYNKALKIITNFEMKAFKRAIIY